MASVTEWLNKADGELAQAEQAWKSGNAGRGRVGSRRAAGMALKALLRLEPNAAYGTSFMHHVAGIADDPKIDGEVREAAWRLSARARPDAGWAHALPDPLTPMADAIIVAQFAKARISQFSSGESAP